MANTGPFLWTGKFNFSRISLSDRVTYLTTIGGPWYFDRASVPQGLINQSHYHEILLLQKFNDVGGKV